MNTVTIHRENSRGIETADSQEAFHLASFRDKPDLSPIFSPQTKFASMAILLALGLLGCSPEPDTYLKISTPPASGLQSSPRYSVERVGLFADTLAYHGQRGIYIIKDKDTGKEYIGVSGIGISEAGSHSQSDGKTTTVYADER